MINKRKRLTRIIASVFMILLLAFSHQNRSSGFKVSEVPSRENNQEAQGTSIVAACSSGDSQNGYLMSTVVFPFTCGERITKTCKNSQWSRPEILFATCKQQCLHPDSKQPVDANTTYSYYLKSQGDSVADCDDARRTTTCMAATGLFSPTPAATRYSSCSPASSSTISALEFLGTGFTRGSGSGTPANTYFSFKNVNSDCLPIYPATVIWRARPEKKTGYYSTFFWANDGNFLWKGGGPDSYWGAHPYPDTGQNNFNAQHWEIATDFGGDIVTTLTGSPRVVAYGQWYTQGFRAWQDVNGEKVHRFYIDLPSLAANSIIEARVVSSFGNTNPPSPALAWGGAPWGADFGNDETYRGLIRGIQIYNRVLTESEMLQETQSPLSTQAGRDSIWYMELNPTLEDMTSDVMSSPVSSCASKKRTPVLRVDQVDINLQNSADRVRIKVKNWSQ